MPKVPPPPPGFVIEAAPKASIPPPPDGFVLEGQQPERGMLGKVADFFTGNDRETRATEELGEVATGLLGPWSDKIPTSARSAISAGILTTFEPSEQLEILRNNLEPLGLRVAEQYDEKGNVIVNVTDGEKISRAMLNKPGFSATDAAQLVGTGALFTPAGRAGLGATGMANAAGRVGLASAATQVAINAGQHLAGREMSAGDAAGEVALAGALGAGGEVVGQAIGKIIPWVKQKIGGRPVTPELRESIRREATRLGVDPQAIDDVINQVAQQADGAVTPNQAMALQAEKEFGIPLTAGQRTYSPHQLSMEDRMRSASIGGKRAQDVILGFEDKVQKPAIDTARQQIQQNLAGTAPAVGSRAEAGGLLKEGVLRAEQQADDAVRQAYAEVGDAALTPEGFKGLLNATRRAVDGIEYVRSPKLAPASAEVRKKLLAAEKQMGALIESGGRVKPIHINRVDEIRKSLGAYADAAANNADRRNIVVMKQAFDDYLDEAVQKALFTGDDAALDALKKARGTFAEYARKFRAQDIRTNGGRKVSDQSGRFIEKLIAANPTDEEVVNSLFGASGFSNKAGADMAQRFKSILGPDSDEWGVVRQEAFRRLIKTNKTATGEVVSGQQTLKAIDDALDKNSSLMREIFTSQEIAKLKRFAAQVRRTQPTPAEINKSRGNPSGSAVQAVRNISDLLGYGSGNLPLIATTKGVELAGGMSKAAKAKNAVRPFRRYNATRPAVVGGAVSASQAAAADE